MSRASIRRRRGAPSRPGPRPARLRRRRPRSAPDEPPLGALAIDLCILERREHVQLARGDELDKPQDLVGHAPRYPLLMRASALVRETHASVGRVADRANRSSGVQISSTIESDPGDAEAPGIATIPLKSRRVPPRPIAGSARPSRRINVSTGSAGRFSRRTPMSTATARRLSSSRAASIAAWASVVGEMPRAPRSSGRATVEWMCPGPLTALARRSDRVGAAVQAATRTAVTARTASARSPRPGWARHRPHAADDARRVNLASPRPQSARNSRILNAARSTGRWRRGRTMSPRRIAAQSDTTRTRCPGGPV